jgi:hypothetical protein
VLCLQQNLTLLFLPMLMYLFML